MKVVNRQVANVRLFQSSGMPSSYVIGIVSPNDFSYEGKTEHYTRLIDAQTVYPGNADRVINVPEGCAIAFESPTGMTWSGKIDGVTELKAVKNLTIDGYSSKRFIVSQALRGGEYLFLVIKKSET